MTSSEPGRPAMGYLLKKFPRLSETFVLGEILGQERLGAGLHVFSRRPPDDEFSSRDRSLMAEHTAEGKESPMSSLKADFITIIVGRSGATSLKPC